MHEAYLTLNGVRTSVVAHGKWVEESLIGSKDIVIILPGNPGVTRFYNTFAKTLHEQLGYPVWCIGHAGHNIPNEKLSPFPELKKKPELYDLKGQIEHKVDFMQKYVPEDARIHLIGHSLGSYIGLQLLEHKFINEKVCNVFLLFPTLEYMGATSNGKFMSRFVLPIVWLIVFLSWIFTVFPKIFQTFLLYIYMYITGIPSEENCESIRSLIKPGILRRVFFLAADEFEHIKNRNNEIILQNLKKIKLYYGKKDGWADQSYYEKIVADIPNINAQLCSYNHTFVLDTPVEIGHIVSGWIAGKP